MFIFVGIVSVLITIAAIFTPVEMHVKIILAAMRYFFIFLLTLSSAAVAYFMACGS